MCGVFQLRWLVVVERMAESLGSSRLLLRRDTGGSPLHLVLLHDLIDGGSDDMTLLFLGLVLESGRGSNTCGRLAVRTERRIGCLLEVLFVNTLTHTRFNHGLKGLRGLLEGVFLWVSVLLRLETTSVIVLLPSVRRGCSGHRLVATVGSNEPHGGNRGNPHRVDIRLVLMLELVHLVLGQDVGLEVDHRDVLHRGPGRLHRVSVGVVTTVPGGHLLLRERKLLWLQRLLQLHVMIYALHRMHTRVHRGHHGVGGHVTVEVRCDGGIGDRV